MRLMPIHVSPTPLQELERDISNPHEDVRRLGKIKLGITRFSFSLPFYTKSSSRPNNNAIKNRTIEEHVTDNNQTTGTTGRKFTPTYIGQNEVLNTAQEHELILSAAPPDLYGILRPTNVASGSKEHVEHIKQVLIDFKPIDHIKHAAKPNSTYTPENDFLWDLYINLARTPSAEDFEFLKLSPPKEETPEAKKSRETLRLLCQIHAHLNKLNKDHLPLADVIHEASQPGNKDSIPHQALIQALAILKTEAPQTSGEQWAMNAFKNGLLTMDADSDFMKIDARLRKMGTWVKRAEKKGLRWSKLLPTIKKNPFKAMKFGTLGADRIYLEKNQEAYKSALGALRDNPDLKDLTLSLDAGKTGISKFLHERQLKAANKALDQLRTNLEPKNDTQNDTPNNHLSFKADYKDAETIIKQLKTIRKFTKHIPTVAVADNLENATSGNGSSPAEHPLTSTLKKHIDTIKDIIGQNKLSHVHRPVQQTENNANVQNNTTTTEEKSFILKHLTHVIDNIQGAARWKMFSGGVWGVGTKGITTTFTNLALGLLARVKIDLRWMRTRLAGVEIAMPAYNMELMLYSSKQTGKQKGFGGSIGPSIGIAEITGGANIKAWASDQKENDGVVLRMHRKSRSPEHASELKKGFKDMLNKLFELSKTTQTSGETLKQLLNEFPDLSVNLIDHSTEHRQAHAASLEANAGIVAGPVKIGPTAEVGVEYQSHIQKDHLDKTGFLKVERHVHGRGLKATAEARLDIRFNAMQDPFRLTPLTLDNLAISADFLQAGRQLRQDIVYHKGRILPFSFYEIEYQSFDDFQNAILSNKNAWDAAKVSTDKNGKVTPGETNVKNFLVSAKKNYNVVQTFAARWELKPTAVELINRHNTAIMLKENSSDENTKKAVEQHRAWVHGLLNHPASYEPRSFRVYERQDRNEGFGLHAAARLEAINQAEGVYTHNRLD